MKCTLIGGARIDMLSHWEYIECPIELIIKEHKTMKDEKHKDFEQIILTFNPIDKGHWIKDWLDSNPNKTMETKTKKYKVEIPEGYEVESTSSFDHYGADGLIMTTTFKPIKKPLPKTWEELGKVSGYVIHEDSSIHAISANADFGEYKSIWPTRELAEAALALSQLLQLRDVYNDGQQLMRKCGLRCNIGNKIIIVFGQCGPLEFNNTTIAEEFKKVFISLIHEARPLL